VRKRGDNSTPLTLSRGLRLPSHQVLHERDRGSISNWEMFGCSDENLPELGEFRRCVWRIAQEYQAQARSARRKCERVFAARMVGEAYSVLQELGEPLLKVV
jgi:hypothetical protein